MTYQETLDYIYAKLPMYQNIGKSAFKKDLDNITALCASFGNPQNKFKSIHIAGTNGKGSTSHILSALYQSNNYKVGLYTSPHLVDFRERIKLNGELCSKIFVTDFIARIQVEIERLNPSFFEITVAMAFTYFAEINVDIAIIETGLGGRLDSTNIIKPIGCIITSIGYDHKDILGDTLELIAAEKAGIIKEETPIVIGEIQDSPKSVIIDKALSVNAPYHYYVENTYQTDLAGTHQQWNIGSAMKLISLLDSVLPTSKANNNAALLDVRSISNFTGRWQTIYDNPLVICDVGHNEEGFGLIASQIKKLGLSPIYVLGFVKGKELSGLSDILPKGLAYHFVKPDVIRGMNANEALENFKNPTKDTSHSYDDLEYCLSESYAACIDTPNSFIFVGGSNFLVADLLLLVKENKLPWNA